jgi:hypothetical protein
MSIKRVFGIVGSAVAPAKFGTFPTFPPQSLNDSLRPKPTFAILACNGSAWARSADTVDRFQIDYW